MCDNNFVAYYRVSTQKQGQSGLGLEAQQAAVLRHIGDGNIVATYTEIETGTSKRERVEIHQAIAHAKRTNSTLIVAKLDRLSRSVSFISALLDSKLDFVCCDFPEADTMMLQMMSIFAEREAKMISERTKAALAVRIANGSKLGVTA